MTVMTFMTVATNSTSIERTGKNSEWCDFIALHSPFHRDFEYKSPWILYRSDPILALLQKCSVYYFGRSLQMLPGSSGRCSTLVWGAALELANYMHAATADLGLDKPGAYPTMC